MKPVQKVIDNFESLPGIGPKTAARLAYYLLHLPQERLERFASSLARLRLDTKICKKCNNIGDQDLCPICSDENRDHKTICVVEQPLDLLAFENADGYKGVYHVLGGAINPLAGITPDELTIDKLMERVKGERPEEIILATNVSMEGEATAMYIAHKVRKLLEDGKQQINIKITRLGRGLPTGADVEYADGQTLTRALEGRKEM
ncbi:recombination protein RecR [Candidatus Collierbacteria bacterium]|nr:recombination protein RecR [Candidatus Collierbacteria bacterium]